MTHFPFNHRWENTATENATDTRAGRRRPLTLIAQRCECGNQRVKEVSGWWRLNESGHLIANE
jgi:hypothetical protein